MLSLICLTTDVRQRAHKTLSQLKLDHQHTAHSCRRCDRRSRSSHRTVFLSSSSRLRSTSPQLDRKVGVQGHALPSGIPPELQGAHKSKTHLSLTQFRCCSVRKKNRAQAPLLSVLFCFISSDVLSSSRIPSLQLCVCGELLQGQVTECTWGYQL